LPPVATELSSSRVRVHDRLRRLQVSSYLYLHILVNRYSAAYTDVSQFAFMQIEREGKSFFCPTACKSLTEDGFCRGIYQSACSRPPPPTTSIFISILQILSLRAYAKQSSKLIYSAMLEDSVVVILLAMTNVCLMFKVAHASEDHSYPVLISSSYNLFVSDRATR